MAKICLLSLSLVLLFSLSFAQQQLKGQCQIQKINALQPQYKIQSEGGVTESYDYNDDQFQCAGAAFLRHTIYRRSLLLPSYTSSPLLAYAVKGFTSSNLYPLYYRFVSIVLLDILSGVLSY